MCGGGGGGGVRRVESGREENSKTLFCKDCSLGSVKKKLSSN